MHQVWHRSSNRVDVVLSISQHASAVFFRPDGKESFREVAYSGLSSYQSLRDNYIGFRVARRADTPPGLPPLSELPPSD